MEGGEKERKREREKETKREREKETKRQRDKERKREREKERKRAIGLVEREDSNKCQLITPSSFVLEAVAHFAQVGAATSLFLAHVVGVALPYPTTNLARVDGDFEVTAPSIYPLSYMQEKPTSTTADSQ